MNYVEQLNLGAGNAPKDGWVNHDLIQHRPEIDVAHDLNVLPWPWDDGTVGLIRAWAVFEHLEIDLIQTFNECWRVLAQDGRLQLKLPRWDIEVSYNDPTHRWFFGSGALDQFDPTTTRGKTYDFYTPFKWEILSPLSKCSSSSMAATLRKVMP